MIRTNDIAYLKECLAFHARRVKESGWSSGSDWRQQVAHHKRQVAWFKRKLEAPLKLKEVPMPKVFEYISEPITIPEVAKRIDEASAKFHDMIQETFYGDEYKIVINDEETKVTQPARGLGKPGIIKSFFNRLLGR